MNRRALAAALVAADDDLPRSRMGRETGTASTSGNITTYRDRMGREVGTAERQRDGAVQYRDRFGRESGSASAPRR
jgi:hypothetical protein